MAIGRGARKNLAARHLSARRSTHGEQILPEVGDPAGGLPGPLSGSGSGVIQRGFDPLNGAVQKARMIVPVARATIVLIEMGSWDRALWTRPKPTTSVTQESASITTLRWVTRLAASSEKLFRTRSPKTSQSLVAASRWKVQPLAPIHVAFMLRGAAATDWQSLKTQGTCGCFRGILSLR